MEQIVLWEIRAHEQGWAGAPTVGVGQPSPGVQAIALKWDPGVLGFLICPDGLVLGVTVPLGASRKMELMISTPQSGSERHMCF